MIRISTFAGKNAHDTGIAKPTETTWDELAQLIVSTNWSPGTFVDGKRLNSALESIELLVLDIDSGCTIEQARAIFEPYKTIIATTKSHQKAKGDQPACDRFRVILQLDQPIRNDRDFKATWFEVHKLCPSIDPACKDSARFFYACKEVVAQWDGLNFVAEKAPAPAPRLVSPLAPKNRLPLSARTTKFLINGAKDGKWHSEIVAALYDFKQQQWTQEEATIRLSMITANGLDDHDYGVIEDIYQNREPRHAPRFANHDALRELVWRCHRLINTADTEQSVMLDLAAGKQYQMDLRAIRRILTVDEYKTFSQERELVVRFEYNPRYTKPLTTDEEGVSVYNQYVPPRWSNEYFYKGKAIPVEAELGTLYRDFFMHLTDGHLESFEYLLDWLATSLRGRNHTILTAIGEEGIGKGTLGEILKQLHGESNYEYCSDQVFKSQFNGKLLNKTLVYVDEVEIRDKEAMNRIKAVVNDSIEVEKKGVDSITARNHASFYFSSNEFGAVRLGPKDRRFSVLQMTDNQMNQTKRDGVLWTAFVDQLNAPENVDSLARYLYGRPVTRNMLLPFRSPRFEEMKEASLQDWEAYTLFKWAPAHGGEEIEIEVVQDQIVDEARLYKYRPSRRAFETLAKKFPDILRITQKGSQRYIQVVQGKKYTLSLYKKDK